MDYTLAAYTPASFRYLPACQGGMGAFHTYNVMGSGVSKHTLQEHAFIVQVGITNLRNRYVEVFRSGRTIVSLTCLISTYAMQNGHGNNGI